MPRPLDATSDDPNPNQPGVRWILRGLSNLGVPVTNVGFFVESARDHREWNTMPSQRRLAYRQRTVLMVRLAIDPNGERWRPGGLSRMEDGKRLTYMTWRGDTERGRWMKPGDAAWWYAVDTEARSPNDYAKRLFGPDFGLGEASQMGEFGLHPKFPRYGYSSFAVWTLGRMRQSLDQLPLRIVPHLYDEYRVEYESIAAWRASCLVLAGLQRESRALEPGYQFHPGILPAPAGVDPLRGLAGKVASFVQRCAEKGFVWTDSPGRGAPTIPRFNRPEEIPSLRRPKGVRHAA